MNPPARLLSRSFLVGILVLSTAYGASALTVKRTNQIINGVYVPVLAVQHNGQTFIHVIGEDGLTRSILFNQKRALEWARAKYGAEVIDASGNDSDGGDAFGGGDGDDGGVYT